MPNEQLADDMEQLLRERLIKLAMEWSEISGMAGLSSSERVAVLSSFLMSFAATIVANTTSMTPHQATSIFAKLFEAAQGKNIC